MRVPIAHPGATPQQIEAHLRALFPRHKVILRGGVPIIGTGAATGVAIKPADPGFVKLGWAFPNLGAQAAMTFAIVLTGLLPGLIVFGIVWLIVSGGVGRLKQEVATVLNGGAPPAAAVSALGGRGEPPTSFATIAAVLCFVYAALTLTSSFAYPIMGSGLFDAIFWIALGVGALLYQGEQKRAFESGTARSGPALWIVAGASLLHGLHLLTNASHAEGLWLVRAVLSALLWLGIGAVLVAVQLKKTPEARRMAPAVLAAGAVFALLGLFTFYDVYHLLDFGMSLGLMVVLVGLRGALWIALGAMLIRHGTALGSSTTVVPIPTQQQAYPQQQQQYPYAAQPGAPGQPPPPWTPPGKT